MSKNNNTKTKKRNTQLLPIILMMGFVPLIVHMFSYNANLSQFDWFPAESDSQIDFFAALMGVRHRLVQFLQRKIVT